MNHGRASGPHGGGKASRRPSIARLWAVCLCALTLLCAVLWICADSLFGGFPYRLQADSRRRNSPDQDVPVPDLIGQTFSADGMVDPARFRLEVTYVYALPGTADIPPPLTIVDQQPRGGARRSRSGDEPLTLRLTVSLGEEQVRVPALVGTDVQTAVITLRSEGLIPAERVSPTGSPIRQTTPGTVVGTDPPAGSTVTPGRVVTLYTAPDDRPGSVLCPDLTGLARADAIRLLESVDLCIGHIDEKIASESAPDTVLTQDRVPHTWVTAGSAVSFTVAADPPDDLQPADEGPFARFLSELLRRYGHRPE